MNEVKLWQYLDLSSIYWPVERCEHQGPHTDNDKGIVNEGYDAAKHIPKDVSLHDVESHVHRDLWKYHGDKYRLASSHICVPYLVAS